MVFCLLVFTSYWIRKRNCTRAFQTLQPFCPACWYEMIRLHFESCHRAPSLKQHAVFVASLQMASTTLSWLLYLIWNCVVICAYWGAAACVSHGGNPAGVFRWLTNVAIWRNTVPPPGTTQQQLICSRKTSLPCTSSSIVQDWAWGIFDNHVRVDKPFVCILSHVLLQFVFIWRLCS